MIVVALGGYEQLNLPITQRITMTNQPNQGETWKTSIG
jgi:hypothetical protein